MVPHKPSRKQRKGKENHLDQTTRNENDSEYSL